MLIGVLTIAVLGVIFLAAFLRLWVSPPVISINLSGLNFPTIPSYLTLQIPTGFTVNSNQYLTTKHEPADIEVKPKEEPIPEAILDYINQESELHAQDARRRRIRALKADTGSWDVAFRLLQREDNGPE